MVDLALLQSIESESIETPNLKCTENKESKGKVGGTVIMKDSKYKYSYNTVRIRQKTKGKPHLK